ncbi:MAG: heparinase II/III-family protein [Treponema sp.]|jgi:hypothetical protein|nr:heparinase II/III-family protein [Treponema sp.]
MIREIKFSRKFKPFPGYDNRSAWDALPEDVKSFYRAEGMRLKGREWEPLTASLYLDFYRNGSRAGYDGRYFKRRWDLFCLALAECIDGGGAYLDDIINGVWLICEETGWVGPAHNNHSLDHSKAEPGAPERKAKELPDIEDGVYIDLFAAETASLLSWVRYFLGEAIARQSPLVMRRIELELERRVFVPFLENDGFFWMGLDNDDPVNNWNPWINSNMLTAFLIFADAFPRAEEGINKAIKSANRFIHFYAEDGGCDEGSSYFSAAGASFLDCVEILGEVCDVSYLYRETRLRNMASYIYRVYVEGDYYVNFADGSPSVDAPAGLLYRTGKKTGDGRLATFAAHLKKNRLYTPAVRPEHFFYRRLADIFMEEIAAGEPFTAPASSWFPGIQVMTARDGNFFVAAKGGHNNESHNHNDIGNFLLYAGGRPVLVDAGAETYTKFTFNEKRYTIWTMRSCYHNTPTINGAEQRAGREYKASCLSFTDDGKTARFSLELAGAYGEDAGLESYRRELVFNRDENLELTDIYTLKEWKAPLALNLLCYEKPGITGGRITLGGGIVLWFDRSLWGAEFETIALADPRIRGNWKKDELYRLRIVKNGADLSGRINLRFTKEEI